MNNELFFRTGNIYRIYMKNFLTYDEIEIFPKPHLNVIIGPNGTGKSSILCGICIGLSGKPELTGRGKNLAEYVKQGKENAVIEIELYNKEGKANNIIVRREFTGNQSKWYLQNREVKQKEVEAKVASLGIQVNNLCQFLPQDRVAEFAKLNKIKLLSSTETAVGETELYRHHQILSDSGRTIQEKKDNLNDVKNQLTTEIQKNELLEDQVGNIKKKEELDKAIKELHKIILFRKYKEKSKEAVDSQGPITVIKKEVGALKAKIEPNVACVKDIDRGLSHYNEQQKKYKEESRRYNFEAEKLNVENEEEAITIAREDYETLLENDMKRKKEISDLKKQLEAIRAQVVENSAEDELKIKQNLLSVTEKVKNYSAKVMNLDYELVSIENEKFDLQSKKNNCERKLEKYCNRDNRLQVLRNHKHRHVYNATLWLRENKAMFRAPVHEPLFTTVDFTNPADAKYLESTVSNQDLIAFVCEDKYDVKTLKAQADANQWVINILYSAPVDPRTYRPSICIDSIKNLGFEAFIKDVVVAPPAVISYLCRNYNIHNIPFAKKANYEDVPAELTNFFIGDRRYSKRRSRYDGAVSTTVSSIKNIFYFTNSIDLEVQRELQRDLDIKTERYAQLERVLQEQKVEKEELDKNLEKVRQEHHHLMMALNSRKELENSLRIKEEQLKMKESNNIDLGDAKRIMDQKIKEAILKMVNKAEKHSQLENKFVKLIEKSFRECIDFADLHQQRMALSRKMENINEEIRNKEDEIRRLELEKKDHEKRAEELLREFCKALNLPTHNHITSEIATEYQKKAFKKSLEEFETIHAEKSAHSKCIITSNNSVLIEFKKREEKITKLREEERGILNSIEGQHGSVKSSRDFWLPRITELAAKINAHFSDFMSQLGCAGEVQLDKGNNEEDFSQYGLAIRVKFRDAEKLKELTVHQQSGGERSVSTALFLMALQTLTAVPFRCVDEINQGMDPTNERKMFTMLVQTTTTENASQYFLITPKLLPNLPYNCRVNFMNITSWFSFSSTRHLSVSNVIKYHKKRKYKTATSRRS